MLQFCELNMRRTSNGPATSTLGVRIGQNIRAARTQMGLTQGQLAESLGIENVTMSRIETGSQVPSIARLQQVADILGTTLSILVADGMDSTNTAALLREAMDGLPPRELEFVRNFVVTYCHHWKSGQET